MSNILIDIGHPAHVHYYKNLAREMESMGHTVFWTVKDLPSAESLLYSYGFDYKRLPKKSDSIFGKLIKQIIYDFILLTFCIKHRINIAIGTSAGIAHISLISRITSIVFDDDDDDVQPYFTKFVSPLADILVSPESLKGKRKRKDTVYYPGFHELAYLHPKRFTPDPSILDSVGISVGDPYFILRFNAFKAHHDIGESGLTLYQKQELVRMLEPFGKVFITTERQIEPELKPYQLKIPPEEIHSFMSYCLAFIGDSQTMTSEAAMLGIPSIRCNSFSGRISYLDELEKRFGLTYSFSPDEFDKLKEKLTDLLSQESLKTSYRDLRNQMLETKIDVTSFWIWIIENRNSLESIKEDSRFFDKFH